MGYIEDRWVGSNGIKWNTVQNGKTVVKIEIWLDMNNDKNWVNVNERTDSGGWGTQGGECGGHSDQILTWVGPIATLRWDGAIDVDIKNLNMREIQPT